MALERTKMAGCFCVPFRRREKERTSPPPARTFSICARFRLISTLFSSNHTWAHAPHFITNSLINSSSVTLNESFVPYLRCECDTPFYKGVFRRTETSNLLIYAHVVPSLFLRTPKRRRRFKRAILPSYGAGSGALSSTLFFLTASLPFSLICRARRVG